jgi:hypothetical protein
MAHFEAIVGESIYWNMRLYGDDARRVAWNIREVCRANEVDETTCAAWRGIVRPARRRDPLPSWIR